jgi:hypothetical protein
MGKLKRRQQHQRETTLRNPRTRANPKIRASRAAHIRRFSRHFFRVIAKTA